VHGPEHRPVGHTQICAKCGILASYHRAGRKRDRTQYYRERYTDSAPREIIAIDGEGYTPKAGRRAGQHLYTYLAACTEDRLVAELVRPDGVTADDVFEWLLDLPRAPLKVGFSLGYDITKWIETMPDMGIWYLMHPDKRQGQKGPRAVVWGDYALNKVSTRFSLRSLADKRQCVIWDLFKFFQTSFVKALKAWKVGDEETIAQISAMKDLRGNFDNPARSKEEQIYCQNECKLLAKLARTLINAHETAGLSLRSFYGPGSTAAVMLDKMGAIDQKVKLSKGLEHAADCAFFGGRFEPSHVGPVSKTIYERDIASAYPYAMARLPCLMHGRWKRIKGRRKVERALTRRDCKTACVEYEILPHAACQVWGPLPHRLRDGNIIFPISGPGGWAWLPEFRAAKEVHPGVRARSAWIFEGSCRCGRPYEKWIVQWYCERLRWGKDGPGLALKLGLNSCYGKSAQRVGSAKFRCLVRAGLITSMTRAMLLQAISAAKTPWNVVELATDSIAAVQELDLPRQELLGTEDAARRATERALDEWRQKGSEPAKKPKPVDPLGAWGIKATHAKGLFIMRPGQRFSLDLKKGDEKSTAARGIGTRVLHANRKQILRRWKRAPMGQATVQQPSIFYGAKSCVSLKPNGQLVRSPLYGVWRDPTPRKISYAPAPKRQEVGGKGHGRSLRLTPWALDWRDRGAVSVAYTKAPKGALAVECEELADLEGEQPDGGGIYLVGGDD
jgi:hypothetical protein